MKLSHLLIVVHLAFCCTTLKAQSSDYRTHLGFGLTDMLHVGIAKRLGNWEIGPQAGYLKHDMGRIVTLGVSASYILNSATNFPDQPGVFLKNLVNYHNDVNADQPEWHWLTTELLAGKNFYFTDDFGVSIEGGLFITLHQSVGYSSDRFSDDQDDDYAFAFPSARVQVFFRF